MTPRLNGDDGHPQGGRSRSAAQPPTLSDMPWRVAKGVEGCDGWAVVKKDDGKVVACHKSRAKANAQIKALYANEAMTAAAVGGLARELLEGSDGMLGLEASRLPFASLTAAPERFPQGPGARRRFEESKVKRYPKGTPVSGKVGGGRFAPGDRITGRTMVGNHEVEGEVVGENRFGPIIETTTGETLTVKDSTAVHAETSTIGLESRDPTSPYPHKGSEGELTGPNYFSPQGAEDAARRMTEAGYPAVAEATDMTSSEFEGPVSVVRLKDGTTFGADSSDKLYEAAYPDEYGPGIDYSQEPTMPSGYHDMPVAGHKSWRVGAWDVDAGQLPDGRWAVDYQSAASPSYQRKYFASEAEAIADAQSFVDTSQQALARSLSTPGDVRSGRDTAEMDDLRAGDAFKNELRRTTNDSFTPSMSARDVFHTSAQHAVRRGLESGRSTERGRARSVAGVLKEIESGALPFTDRELADAVERMNRVDTGGPDRSVNEMMLEVVQGLAIKHGDRRRRRGVTAAAPFFDESRHPRHPKGTREGGRFAQALETARELGREGGGERDYAQEAITSPTTEGSRNAMQAMAREVTGEAGELPDDAVDALSDAYWEGVGESTKTISSDSSSPQMSEELVRPEGTKFGVQGRRYFTRSQMDPLVGQNVQVRDWFGEVNAEITGVHEGESGFIDGVSLRLPDGREVPYFSLNATREIARQDIRTTSSESSSPQMPRPPYSDPKIPDDLTGVMRDAYAMKPKIVPLGTAVRDTSDFSQRWGRIVTLPDADGFVGFEPLDGGEPYGTHISTLTRNKYRKYPVIGIEDADGNVGYDPDSDPANIRTTSSEKHDPPMPTRRDVGLALTVEDWAKNRSKKEVNEVTRRMRRRARGITAAVTIPVAPPKDWFKDPGLSRGTPLTVTSDGRVYGHLALWDACHIGDPSGPGVCVAPPRSGTGYTLFHLGELETAEGEIVPVGKITLGTGHASLQASRGAATAHYDNTGMVVADVRAGEDGHGIWISGALRPSVSEAQVRELRAAGVSGDWRRYRNALELVAALAVNVPGFPIPRVAALVAPELDGDERVTLVAAGLHAPLVPGMTDDEAHARIEALSLLAGVGGEPVMDLYFPR